MPRVFRLHNVARCKDALQVRFCTVAVAGGLCDWVVLYGTGPSTGLLGNNVGRNQAPKLKQHEPSKAGESDQAF